jgi:sec-independent protein translocase protein TatB
VNISPEKLIVIGILALLILGPNRLPEVARQAGKLLSDLRRMSGSLQTELKGALTEPQQALAHAVDEFGIKDLRSSMRDTITSVGGVAAAVTGTPAAPAPLTPPAPAPHALPPAAAVVPRATVPVPDDPSFN